MSAKCDQDYFFLFIYIDRTMGIRFINAPLFLVITSRALAQPTK